MPKLAILLRNSREMRLAYNNMLYYVLYAIFLKCVTSLEIHGNTMQNNVQNKSQNDRKVMMKQSQNVSHGAIKEEQSALMFYQKKYSYLKNKNNHCITSPNLSFSQEAEEIVVNKIECTSHLIKCRNYLAWQLVVMQGWVILLRRTQIKDRRITGLDSSFCDIIFNWHYFLALSKYCLLRS